MRVYTIDVEPPPVFVNAGVCHGLPGYVHVRQDLRVSELFVIEQGTLFMDLEGARSKAGRGSVLFHPAGTRQQGYAPSADGVKFIWITFTAEVSARDLSEPDIRQLGEYIGQKELATARRTTRLTIPALSTPAHFSEIVGLAYGLAERRPGYPIEKSARICLLLSRLSVSFFVERRPRVKSREGQLVKDIKYWVKKNLGQPLSPRTVAGFVEMNPDYVSRVFKKSTGLRLSEYILIRKMERAKHLLHSGSSVKKTAFRTGYASAEHFSRTFKKHCGFAPSVYAQIAGDIYRN